MCKNDLEKDLAKFDLKSDTDRVRIVSYLSALIAVGRQDDLIGLFKYLKQGEFDIKAIYETVLQSYLFLGFPRMIEAVIAFNEVYGENSIPYQAEFGKISQDEATLWFENGIKLCKQVYGENFERLKKRFLTISPEMFRWMVIEGYGKVLTRPGLHSIERELAEVAALIVDKRERQLVSHIMGSLNVGAPIELIKQVNEDIKELAGDEAYGQAVALISRVESKR